MTACGRKGQGSSRAFATSAQLYVSRPEATGVSGAGDQTPGRAISEPISGPGFELGIVGRGRGGDLTIRASKRKENVEIRWRREAG